MKGNYNKDCSVVYTLLHAVINTKQTVSKQSFTELEVKRTNVSIVIVSPIQN